MASAPIHPGDSRTQVSLPRYRLRLAAALLALATLSGCQSISMNTAQLRVIDASPDAGVVDAYQNSSAVAYNLGFGTMTSYVPMQPGSYSLATAKAGTRQTLATSTDTLAAGKQYTEIIGSSLANLQQNLLLDQSFPAPSGQVAIRLINQATRSGPVDVYLVPHSAKVANISPLAVNLNFGVNSGYLAIPEGTYALVVVPAGTVLASSTVTLLSGAQVEYASGAVRTVVLIDQDTPATQHSPGVKAIVADDVDAL